MTLHFATLKVARMCAVVTSIALFVIGNTAAAAVITYAAPIDFNNANQVSTTDFLIQAGNEGNSGTDVTVNGVLFASSSIGGFDFVNSDLHNETANPITGMTVQEQSDLLDNITFGAGVGAFNIDGLTVGQNYTVQIISADARSNTVGLEMGWPGSHVAALDIPQIITGTFTADATAQDLGPFTYAGNPDYIINAFQVRGTVPAVLPLVLTINRDSGTTLLTNPTGNVTDYDVAGYSIRSDAGAILDGNWTSIADGNVDWNEFVSSKEEVAEGTIEAATSLTAGNSLSLGNLWLQNITEDFAVEVLLDDNSVLTSAAGDIEVAFEGGLNGGDPYDVGDLNFDGGVNTDDWPVFRNAWTSDLSGLTTAEGYRMSDLDLDGDSDIDDFDVFREAFEAANGAGSFAKMVSVPEPSSVFLVLAGLIFGAYTLRRSTSSSAMRSPEPIAACLCLALIACVGPAQADNTLVSHFTMGETDPTGGLDDSVGASDMTLAAGTQATGPAAPDAAGSTASGDFDASTRFEVGDFAPGVVDGNQAITNPLTGTNYLIEAWVNPDGTSANQVILSDGHGGAGTLVFQNGTGFGLAIGGAGGFWNVGPTVVSPGTWYHLALVRDPSFNGGAATLLLNGQPEIAFGGGGTLPWVSGAAIGDQGTGGFAFDGQIDDVRFKTVENFFAPDDLSIEVTTPLALEVSTNTGTVKILNQSGDAFDFNSYEITSGDGSLNLAGWNSLEDQDSLDFPAGDGSGNGWEEAGGASASSLAEAFLSGNSTLSDAGALTLGSAYDTTMDAQDLRFHVRLPDGSVQRYQVSYVTSPFLDGDYDGSGAVDQGDLDLVLLNWGQPAPPAWVNQIPGGPVGSGDLDLVRTNWGSTSAVAASAAVPEPSTICLLGLLGVIGLAGRRRWVRMARTTAIGPAVLFAAAVVAWAVASGSAFATVTNDRLYSLGDEPVEDAPNAVGGVVGTGPANANPGNTLDSVGVAFTGNFQDLKQFGGAVYVDVDEVDGLGRPGAPVDSLGVQFDGNNDVVHGLNSTGNGGLGFPGDSTPQNPEDNYAQIFSRGIQLWAYPTNGGSATRQDLVNDTYQFGIHITETDTWGMTWGSSGGTTGRVIESAEAVTFNDWTHVMQHSFGAGGSVLYVNGIAVATSGFNGAEFYHPNNAAANLDITVGANLSANGDFFTGTLDELQIYVAGDNTGVDPVIPEITQPGRDYGTFNVGTDNDYIAGLGLQPGDATGDGKVQGDGSGGADDDVAVFISHWREEQVIGSIIIGDLDSRLNQADFNFDGVTDFYDWAILRANHPTPASLNLGALLSSASVPEPSTLGLAAMVGMIALLQRRRLRRPGGVVCRA